MKKQNTKSTISLKGIPCYPVEEMLQYKFGKENSENILGVKLNQLESNVISSIFNHLTNTKCQKCIELYLSLKIPNERTEEKPELSAYSQMILEKENMELTQVKIGKKDDQYVVNGELTSKAILITIAVVIMLHKYRKAAETSGIRLSEIHPHMLMETEEFSILVVQMRDRVILRFSSNMLTPGQLSIDKKRSELRKTKNIGVYETFLGYVEKMPKSMEISINVGKETYTFQTQLKRELN